MKFIFLTVFPEQSFHNTWNVFRNELSRRRMFFAFSFSSSSSVMVIVQR